MFLNVSFRISTLRLHLFGVVEEHHVIPIPFDNLIMTGISEKVGVGSVIEPKVADIVGRQTKCTSRVENRDVSCVWRIIVYSAISVCDASDRLIEKSFGS